MKMKNMISTLILAATAFLVLNGLSGCKGDDCEPGEDCHVHDQELITRLQVQITDSASGTLVASPTFDDADGAGGNPPTIDSIQIMSNTTYNVALKVFAQHGDHSDEITSEILAEGDEHLFCFTASGVAVTIVRTDSDGVYEIGLASRWRSSAAGQGNLRITLKHQAGGIKDGTCTPGDTDIEVDFPLEVL